MTALPHARPRADVRAPSARPAPASARLAALAAGVVLAALVAPAGCKSGGAKKIARDKDAQAVVVVESSPDAVARVDEVEPNDAIASATRLADAGLTSAASASGSELASAGGRGSLDGEADVDLYAFSVAEAGWLSAEVSGIDGVDLILDVRGADGAVLARSDRGPALVVEGLSNFPVEPGDYFLGVSEFVKKRRPRKPRKGGAADPADGARTGPSPTYEVTARVIQVPDLHEREPNDDIDTAGDILLGDERMAWAGWNRDVDAWRIPAWGLTPQYALDLDLEGVPGVTFSLSLLDPDRKPILERAGVKDGGLAVRNVVPVAVDPGSGGADAAPAAAAPGRRAARDDDGGEDAGAGSGRYYYVVVSARRSNPLDKYRLRVSTRLVDPGEEVEPNDAPAQAARLADAARPGDAGEITGFITVGDADCYALSARAAALIEAEVSPDADLDVRLEVLDAAGATLADSKAGKRGAAEAVTDVRAPAGQTVVLRVTGRTARASGYKLAWSVAADDGRAAPGGASEVLEGEYESD